MDYKVEIELEAKVRWWARAVFWLCKHAMGFALSYGVATKVRDVAAPKSRGEVKT